MTKRRVSPIIKNNLTTDFITGFFNSLEETKIMYCVLRNYQSLPEKIENDIDILVDIKSITRFKTFFYKFVGSRNFRIIRSVKRHCFFSFVLIPEKVFNSPVIKIDFWTRIFWRGMEYASSKYIFQNLKKFNNFWVIHPGIEAYISVFKEFLQFGKVKDLGNQLHKKKFHNLAGKYPDQFRKSGAAFFGKKLAELALDYILRENWSALEKSINKFRFALLFRSLIQFNVFQFGRWLFFLSGQFRHKIINSPGFFICFIGPDGSGKTTISKNLPKILIDIFPRISYFHGHFKILPPLKTYFGFLKRNSRQYHLNNTDIIKNLGSNVLKPMPFFKAALYISYYFFDYLFGYLIIKSHKALGALIIFDRYFYDYMIYRTYDNFPGFLKNILFFLIPKPDLLIWLKNHPRRIHSRKQELTIEDITSQIMRIEKIIAQTSNGIAVSTSGSLKKTLTEIRIAILNKLIMQNYKR